jgi:S1-C subfamily serine protease
MEETNDNSDDDPRTPLVPRTMISQNNVNHDDNVVQNNGNDMLHDATVPGAPNATPEIPASWVTPIDDDGMIRQTASAEAAAETTTSSTSARDVCPETPNSSLLREWNHRPSNDIQHPQHAEVTAANTPTATQQMIQLRNRSALNSEASPVPPVAPAVVLTEDDDDETPGEPHRLSQPPPSPSAATSSSVHRRTGSGGSIVNLLGSAVSSATTTTAYPVATFVSNFVRNVSNIGDEIRGHIYASAIPAESSEPSHDESSRTASSPPMHVVTSSSSTRSEPFLSTATTLHDLDDMMMAVTDDQNAQQEFVLIDGDLVAIPMAHSSHRPRGGGAGNRFHQYHWQPHASTGGRASQSLSGAEDETNTAASPNDISRTEEHELYFLEQQERANCKSNRMRKGVRKFKRWKKTLKKRLGLQRRPDGTLQDIPSELATTDEENSAQFSVLTPPQLLQSSQQQSVGIPATTTAASARSVGPYTTDDDSTIATNAAPSYSENSSGAPASLTTPASSPGRSACDAAAGKQRFPQKKKKNRLGWLRDASDRSAASTSSSSLTPYHPYQQQQQQSHQRPMAAITTTSAPTVTTPLGASSSDLASMNRDGSVASFDVASFDSSSAAASAMPPSMAARAAMPTVAEISMEMTSSAGTAATVPAEYMALSSLHAAAPSTAPPGLGLRPDLAHHAAYHRSNSAMTAAAAAAGGGAASSTEPLMPDPHHFHRSTSIAAEASFVGNADALCVEAGVLPDSVAATEYYIEDRLDDYDKFDDKKELYDPFLRSMVPPDMDFKVDKLDAPSVDNMLRQAGQFAEDLEDSPQDTPLVPRLKMGPKGKSDGESVPLSMATTKDALVHNDILKLVLVGANDVDKSGLARSLRKSTKKPKKRNNFVVDVHSWMPPNSDNVKFTVWDVLGANGTNDDPYAPNFGAHPGTQSLFFSDRSLYLLVWDMATNNSKTFRKTRHFKSDDSDSDDDSDNEDDLNEYVAEEANRQADRALQTDIEDRVLSWVDTVARRGSHSAVLPIALVPSNMSPDEAKRRCDIMQTLIMEHTERKFPSGLVPPKVLLGAETVICVSLDTQMGMDYLEEMILDIATDASHSVFDHVGTPVPPGTVQVLETVRRLKENSNKLVLVDHLMAELPMGVDLSVEAVMSSLHFLASIGEVLYFGGTDEMLDHYVILSRKWLVSALSCILRNDLKRELSETRRFMNMQCLYSNQQFPESHVTHTFSNNASSCPVVSSHDTQMLWQSMNFMREAADRSSQLNENSTTASTMFGFLERLLVHTGVFLPLDIDRFVSSDSVYFVPSLLSRESVRDVWTYKSSESWMCTLCHSWLFRDGAPVGLIEHITVALLRDLYESSHIVASNANINGSSHGPPARSQTFPFGQNSLTEFIDNHGDDEPIGHIKIHQIVCWKNSVLIKIGRVFPAENELRESFVEMFVAITDQSSPHAVASDAMRSNMQRLVVSGKGQVGHFGRKLWKGGYNIVLDSIKASVADCTNVDRQVVCPECLAYAHPSSACTWSWDSVRVASDPVVRCMRGHRVSNHLICGSIPAASKVDGGKAGDAHKKPVKELLPAVVVVGLWDDMTKTIRNVGSGFIADRKQGLIVTAAHILYNMEEGRNFGEPYFGMKNGRAVIGIIPEDGKEGHAVFRYFAEIVAEDIHNMDACVLKITTRLENDVDDDTMVGEQPEKVVENFQQESLQPMKTTRRFELEEAVRVMGFNQGGEGLLEKGKHVNRSVDFAKGYIVKQFNLTDDHSSTSGDSSSTGCGFQPREEIVVMCPTISGHSGGPCVNDEGKVVGILSRGDPVDRQRCYLVPSSEIKALLSKAKKRGGLKVP